MARRRRLKVVLKGDERLAGELALQYQERTVREYRRLIGFRDLKAYRWRFSFGEGREIEMSTCQNVDTMTVTVAAQAPSQPAAIEEKTLPTLAIYPVLAYDLFFRRTGLPYSAQIDGFLFGNPVEGVYYQEEGEKPNIWLRMPDSEVIISKLEKVSKYTMTSDGDSQRTGSTAWSDPDPGDTVTPEMEDMTGETYLFGAPYAHTLSSSDPQIIHWFRHVTNKPNVSTEQDIGRWGLAHPYWHIEGFAEVDNEYAGELFAPQWHPEDGCQRRDIHYTDAGASWIELGDGTQVLRRSNTGSTDKTEVIQGVWEPAWAEWATDYAVTGSDIVMDAGAEVDQSLDAARGGAGYIFIYTEYDMSENSGSFRRTENGVETVDTSYGNAAGTESVRYALHVNGQDFTLLETLGWDDYVYTRTCDIYAFGADYVYVYSYWRSGDDSFYYGMVYKDQHHTSGPFPRDTSLGGTWTHDLFDLKEKRGRWGSSFCRAALMTLRGRRPEFEAHHNAADYEAHLE